MGRWWGKTAFSPKVFVGELPFTFIYSRPAVEQNFYLFSSSAGFCGTCSATSR